MNTNTRKNKRGGGFFDLFSGSNPSATNTAMSNLKGKRNYNMKHSKSKVANFLAQPGAIKYTNKERIEESYQKAIGELKKIEQPKETASALKTIALKLKEASESDEARKTGAVVITIPVGIAQLAWKAMWMFLAAMAFLFVDMPSMGSIPVSAYLMPNRNFNTTRRAFNKAKNITGST
jgi:hypothetical protein